MTFNPNEQRDQSGKWTADGAVSKLDSMSYEDAAKQFEQNTLNEDARRIKLAATQVATDLKYDPEMITVRTDDKKFTLNGKLYDYAGAAYISGPDLGKIELYAKQLAPSSVATVTAHEIGHQKFQKFIDDYQVEYKQMQEDTKDTRNKDIDLVMRYDGMLKAPYADKYPTYQKYTEVMMPSVIDNFAKTDGITEYSEQWWKAWHEQKANTSQAMHETIAEMTAREYVQGPSYEHEAAKFKAAGYSLDMGHDYSVRKWKTDIKVDPSELPPELKSSFEKLTQTLGRRKPYGNPVYKDPAPEWVALFDAINEHWDHTHK